MRNKRLLITLLVAAILVLAIAGSAFALAGKNGDTQKGVWGNSVNSQACQQGAAGANCPNVANPAACPKANGTGTCVNAAAGTAAGGAAGAGTGCCGR